MPQSLTVDKGVFQDLDTCHISPLQTVVCVSVLLTHSGGVAVSESFDPDGGNCLVRGGTL